MMTIQSFRLLFLLAFVCFLWTLSHALPTLIIFLYRFTSCVLLTALIASFCYPSAKLRIKSQRVSPYNKAVLITGCASGFGYELAKRLDAIGFLVFASCRSPTGPCVEDLKISCSERLHLLQLDVTSQESVASALQYVKNNLNGRDLWAVVNNAGVHLGFDLSWGGNDIFKNFDVNTLGPIRLTATFLPLLKQCRGRVVTVSSVGGRICGPHQAFYTMSKYAAVAMTDCLRRELNQLDVTVVGVDPSVFRTPLITRGLRDSKEEVEKSNKITMEIFGTDYVKRVKERLHFHGETVASSKTHVVAQCLENAVTLEKPNNGYLVFKNTLTSVFVHLLLCSPRFAQEIFIRTTLNIDRVPVLNKFALL